MTEVAGTDPRTFLLLGQKYMANKNFNGARDAFKSSFKLSHTPDALVGLAAADQQTRNFNEAIQIYEALDKNAAPLVKANPVLLYNLAKPTRVQTSRRRRRLPTFASWRSSSPGRKVTIK